MLHFEQIEVKKTNAACYSQTLLTNNQTTWHHNPEHTTYIFITMEMPTLQ